MRLEALPCWGRAGASVCKDCELRQIPADYAGSFPLLELQLPAVEHIGTDAEFCRERRYGGTHSPDASVRLEEGEVCAGGDGAHAAECAPDIGATVRLSVGGPEGCAGYVRQSTDGGALA